MPCGCRDPYFHTWEGAREGIGGGVMRQKQPQQILNCSPPFSFSQKDLPLFEVVC